MKGVEMQVTEMDAVPVRALDDVVHTVEVPGQGFGELARRVLP